MDDADTRLHVDVIVRRLQAEDHPVKPVLLDRRQELRHQLVGGAGALAFSTNVSNETSILTPGCGDLTTGCGNLQALSGFQTSPVLRQQRPDLFGQES